MLNKVARFLVRHIPESVITKIQKPTTKVQSVIKEQTGKLYLPDAKRTVLNAINAKDLHREEVRQKVLKCNNYLIFREYLQKLNDQIEISRLLNKSSESVPFTEIHLTEIEAQQAYIREREDEYIANGTVFFYKTFEHETLPPREIIHGHTTDMTTFMASARASAEVKNCFPQGMRFRVIANKSECGDDSTTNQTTVNTFIVIYDN